MVRPNRDPILKLGFETEIGYHPVLHEPDFRNKTIIQKKVVPFQRGVVAEKRGFLS